MSQALSNPFLRIVIILVVGGLIILSAILNYKYWASQAPTPELGYLMGSASFLVDLIKPMTPFFLARAINNNKITQILATVLLMVTCVCFSITSAVGLSSIARFDGGTIRQGKADTYTNLQQERIRLVATIDSNTTLRHPDEIDAQMMAVLAEPIKRGSKSFGTIGGRSKNCSKPDRRSREGCARYARLVAQKATATVRQHNIAQLKSIDKQLTDLRANGLVSTGDPQAKVFAAMFGINSIEVVRNGLVILFAVTLEYAGLVVPFFIWTRGDQGSSKPATPTKPKSQPNKPPTIATLKPV